MKKKIKKINEFLDVFDNFDYDKSELSKEDIEKISEENRIKVDENINKLGIKKKKIPITMEEYNNRINKFRKDGFLSMSDEEINDFHMKKFGCPYIPPKNIDSNESS